MRSLSGGIIHNLKTKFRVEHYKRRLDRLNPGGVPYAKPLISAGELLEAIRAKRAMLRQLEAQLNERQRPAEF
jgi:hypothetical protein